MPDQALCNIKVLDFTQHVAGPYCTKLMADQGADVIKVERPGTGDLARRLGPYPDDIPHPERSGLFLHLNTNKRSITLDLNTHAGRNIAQKLAAESEVGYRRHNQLWVNRFQTGDHGVFRVRLPISEIC